MYTQVSSADLRSALNDSRTCNRLYNEIADQFNKDEYLIAPAHVEIRRAYTQVVRILRSGIDWEIKRDFAIEFDRIATALATMKRPSKRRDAFQACYDDLAQVQDDIDAIYEQNHAWDD